MLDDWPGDWVGGDVLMALQTDEKCGLPDSHRKDDPHLFNDGGTLWLSGQGDGEWLWMSGDAPENVC